MRRAVVSACERARRPEPRETADLDGKHWIDLGRWCRAIAALEGITLDEATAALAKRWVDTPRTTRKPHPLSWLASNPDEYWRRSSTEPQLGGGETVDDLIADLNRKPEARTA